MLKLFIITVAFLALAVAGIAIKIWAKKDGEFDGTCAGKNVRMKQEGIVCGCGKQESCDSNLDNQLAE